MTDERPAMPAADTIAVGFQTLVEGLRDDVREDIRDLRTHVESVAVAQHNELAATEARVTAQVETVARDQRDTRALIEGFAKGHAQEHEDEATERRAAHGTFYDFIRHFELDQARRDGALGIARYSVELLSKNAPRLIAIIVAVAAALGFATGGISVQVGGS
jgi:hypothetical protein